jgi:D-methionine transport system ATP-binding protein
MVIKVQNLSKCFLKSSRFPSYALKNIHLSLDRGDIFGIIGMSGAGKSTLMRCLTGLERPSEGKILVDGEEISSLKGKDLRRARRKMGMIFQHFNLFYSRTALENVLYPMELEKRKGESARINAQELLELVGLASKQDFYPSQLSGGEKQRVAIARALANQPSVLLCDEATSALDPKNTRSILSLLRELNQNFGLTILLITHEMNVIKEICTKAAVLEKGEIVEMGSVLHLFTAPKHPTTQHFLSHMIHEMPENLKLPHANHELLRLVFTGKTVEEPLISRVVKNFNVEVNILLGSIDRLQAATVGNLLIELSGSEESRIQARQFLIDHGVICEEIHP